MGKPKRQLRNIPIGAKVTRKRYLKIIKKCEKLDISISEYLNRLVEKDIDESIQ